MSAYYIPGAEDVELNKMPFLTLGSPASETIISQRGEGCDRVRIRCFGNPEKGALRRLGSLTRLRRVGH